MTFKRAKLNDETQQPKSSKVIGTHSGTFQADEAMGVFLLRQLPDYRNSAVIRSRDLTVLNQQADIVLDVGGTYNHEVLRYDHHQRGYDERFQNDPKRCTKLSAAGLIYRHYGKAVIAQYYPHLTPDLVDVTYVQLYDTLLQALDAVDTGVELVPPGVTAVYKDTTGLPQRVARLNPRWNEVDPETGKTPSLDDRFEQAVQICGHDFEAVLTHIVEADLPARALVEQALVERFTVDASGEVITLASGGMPWRHALYAWEDAQDITPLIKFVLYPDTAGMWRVQAVTVQGKAFENRLSLPPAWRGLRDAQLVAQCHIATARFVHAAGFIGGADTYEDAVAMARLALQQQGSKKDE